MATFASSPMPFTTLVNSRRRSSVSAGIGIRTTSPSVCGLTPRSPLRMASAMSAPQQTMLWDLVREWAGIMNDAFAEPRMAEIRANLADTYFAWSGPTTNGSVAYFRVQGPTLVIEYAPQGSVDHIHTIYRDPTNDYGSKFARK